MQRINIFTSINHIGNEYDTLKLAKKYPVKFHYMENNVRRWTRYSARPEPQTWLSPDEFEWVTHYEPGKYDVAILRVDQQHTDPRIGKGWIYSDLNNLIQDIPKIVVNHGTPMWDDYYTEDIVINGGEAHTMKGPQKIVGMKEKIGDNFMIVNSYEAVERWGKYYTNIMSDEPDKDTGEHYVIGQQEHEGIKNAYPIIHGMTATEWLDLPKEPRVVIQLSPGGLDKYYNRSLLTAIKGAVYEKSGLQVLHIPLRDGGYEPKDWLDYKEVLGSSLIYINPTLDSPMPRSRTEAMLSGCCVITSKHHGASDFIEDGVDGLIAPDNPLSYANAIDLLINGGYKLAEEIGQRGKAKAIKLFDNDRYCEQMYNTIVQVVNGEKPVWDGKKIW